MLDERIGPVRRRPAFLTHRPQPTRPDIARQARIGQREPKLFKLIAQRAGPQMRVLAQPCAHVVSERRERVLTGRFAHAGRGHPGDVVADRPAISAGVAGDRRDRPPPFVQCVYLHVFLSCEHEKADHLRLELLASDTSSIEGDPPSLAEPRGEHFRLAELGSFSERDHRRGVPPSSSPQTRRRRRETREDVFRALFSSYSPNACRGHPKPPGQRPGNRWIPRGAYKSPGIGVDPENLSAQRRYCSHGTAGPGAHVRGDRDDRRPARQVIYALRRRRYSYTKIARAVGVSPGAVRASLARTAAKLGQGTGSADWDVDLR